MEKLISDFSFGLFIWQSFIFIILILLLRKYAWGPILSAVNQREESIANALNSAEEAKKEMANLTSANEKLLKEAREKRDLMLKEARETKKQMVTEAKNQAIEEGDKMIANAKEVIKTERKAAVADIKNQVAILSIDIAEKIVKGDLSTDDKHKTLVNDLIADVNLN